jgi:PTS system nitrogen regulatory IIA component
MQVSLRDAARFLGVDESTLQRWARRGEIPAQKVDDQYRFHRVDLLAFAAEHASEVTPGVLPEQAPAGTDELPRLRAALVAGGVHHDVPGADKASALRAVVDRLPLPPGIDRGFLHQMLLAREQLGSTGLGHGIALPHPRDPIVLRVSSPAVSVAYLAAPIDFDALDGRPVHTLFTLVSPSVRVHLHLLAVLGAALRDPAVLACIDRRAPGPELVAAIGRVEDALPARRGDAR